ncbi:MAG: hypothetical protein NVSMB48_07920 [Marmoricola sp.]
MSMSIDSTPHRTTLDLTISATHDVLHERLRAAMASHGATPPTRPSRGAYPETDTFLASTARHLAAVSAVLVPAALHALADGDERARTFVHQSRRLELSLSQVKAKLYGEAHAIHRTWTAVWDEVGQEFSAAMSMERDLVDDLRERLTDEEMNALALRVYRAELRAPTRPHPFLPHRGLAGRVARRITHGVDHFWDSTEGRMLPEPVHPHHPAGLMTHYLLGDPDPAPED